MIKRGKAVALYDDDLKPKQRSAGGNAVTTLWVTNEFPVDVSGGRDALRRQQVCRRRQTGACFVLSIFRRPRTRPRLRLLTMTGCSWRWGSIRRRRATPDIPIRTEPKASTTRLCSTAKSTCSWTIKGPFEERRCPGSTKQTNHAWVNNSGSNCRIAFGFLIDAKAPPAWRQGLGNHTPLAGLSTQRPCGEHRAHYPAQSPLHRRSRLNFAAKNGPCAGSTEYLPKARYCRVSILKLDLGLSGQFYTEQREAVCLKCWSKKG